MDSYSIFPTNFRIVFLPHANTVMLLEPFCGTITEPGLPCGITASIDRPWGGTEFDSHG